MADTKDDEVSRKIFFDGDFEQPIISKATQTILNINELDRAKALQFELEGNVYNPKPIEIYIDSYGGSVFPCFGLLSVIKNSKTPVHTICVGYAMSCGYMLLISGHKRFAMEYSTVMYHQISSVAWGKLKDMEENVHTTKSLQKVMEKMTLERTKFTKKKLRKIYKGKLDYYMSAEKALKHGVVDEIIR